MKNILFVDDDQRILSGLRRGLRELKAEWGLHFATTGEEALELMTRVPVEVLVSDYRMPGMNGFKLLSRVQQVNPRTIRIMLTGQPDKETYAQSISLCHYFLWKPLEVEALMPVLKRISALEGILDTPALTTTLRGILALPALPEIYSELVCELDRPESDYARIVTLIRQDMGLAMQVLKIVNSSFIGLKRQIGSVDEGIRYLGLNTLRSLVLGHHVFAISGDLEYGESEVHELFHHSLCCACLAEKCLGEVDDPEMSCQVAFAGLLHDVGKLFLMHYLPDEYRRIMQMRDVTGLSQSQAEHAVLQTTHAEIGTYLAKLWNLPHFIAESIYLHHQDDKACLYGTSAVVRAVWHANQICCGRVEQSAEQWGQIKDNPEVLSVLKSVRTLRRSFPP